MTPTPPKGSLEDLFRHHLLESEAAAVPPHPHVWEQLDNSLLLAQNEKYRRRLLVYRWAVAASLLLATLAGGGWWHSQRQAPTPLAQATPAGAGALGAAGRVARRPRHQDAVASLGAGRAAGTTPAVAARVPSAGAVGSVSSTSNAPAIAQFTTPSSRRYYSATPAGSGRQQPGPLAAGTAGAGRTKAGLARRAPGAYPLAANPTGTSEAVGSVVSRFPAPTPPAGGQRQASSVAAARSLTGQPNAAFAAATRPTGSAAEPMAGTDAGLGLAANAAGQPLAVATATDALATRPAQLALADAAGLPGSLSALPLSESPSPTLARRWQYGLGYASSVYQPNIDFSRATATYNAALGSFSADVTRNAAAEYRRNLRPGLGQRLSLWATRRLGTGRFGLRTGLELAQNTASSATTMDFVGEQVPDLSLNLNYTVAPARLHNTSFRYRSASVPVEVHYGNPAKTGFSFYGRVGGLITALLNVRSEVEGNPEATRTYTLMSASSPYRHLSGSVRGGAGVQYRPTGHQWALSLGPVAEAGILSLNADPVQGFLSQKRPYSIGLEAGVELGRTPHVLRPKAE